MALDEDEYSSCVIDCWTMEIRQQHKSQLRWEKMHQKRQKYLMPSATLRDNSTNHMVWMNTATPRSIIIPVLRLTVKYPRLLMTLMSQWLINSLKNNTKDKLLFDTSCTICTTGLHRTHKLTKCSGRQLTNKGTNKMR